MTLTKFAPKINLNKLRINKSLKEKLHCDWNKKTIKMTNFEYLRQFVKKISLLSVFIKNRCGPREFPNRLRENVVSKHRAYIMYVVTMKT